MCCRRAKKNRGQKSICRHKKGGQYSMSHWKIGVKILCSKSWEGQNSMKAKIWGSKFYFFLVEPLVKILCSLKRGVKILYFFPVPWKRGVKTAEPTNQLHWRGAPPPQVWELGSKGDVKWGIMNLVQNICAVASSAAFYHGLQLGILLGSHYYPIQSTATHLMVPSTDSKAYGDLNHSSHCSLAVCRCDRVQLNQWTHCTLSIT